MTMLLRCGSLAVGLLSLALLGCGQGQANGVRITERGVFINDAAHNRKDAEQTIVEHFARDLGPHWTMSVAIAPDPRLIEARNDLDSEFRWNAATVAVTLTGNGLLAEPLVSEERIRTEITEFLHKLQEPKGQPVTVTVVRTLAKVDQPPVVVPAAPGTVRTYTLQANDTLADISSAFYGTPNRWRELVTANPGLDPAALTPGTVITIP
jgi:hypothetical protein